MCVGGNHSDEDSGGGGRDSSSFTSREVNSALEGKQLLTSLTLAIKFGASGHGRGSHGRLQRSPDPSQNVPHHKVENG